jgi:hypothetical protein
MGKSKVNTADVVDETIVEDVIDDVVKPEEIVAKPEGKEDLLAELKKKLEATNERVQKDIKEVFASRKPFKIDVEVTPTVTDIKYRDRPVDEGVTGSRNHIFTIDRDKKTPKLASAKVMPPRGNAVKDKGAKVNIGESRGAFKIFKDKPVKN